jgi:hypothetical protein
MSRWIIEIEVTTPDKNEFDSARVTEGLSALIDRLEAYEADGHVEAGAPDYGYLLTFVVESDLLSTAQANALAVFTEAQPAAHLPVFPPTRMHCILESDRRIPL